MRFQLARVSSVLMLAALGAEPARATCADPDDFLILVGVSSTDTLSEGELNAEAARWAENCRIEGYDNRLADYCAIPYLNPTGLGWKRTSR